MKVMSVFKNLTFYDFQIIQDVCNMILKDYITIYSRKKVTDI